MSIPGLDFSHWQGEPDPEKMKANGIQFAIVKAGEVWIGKTGKPAVKDDKHDSNINRLKMAGIICGDYYYYHPSIGASRQARHYADIYLISKPDLPPIIDCEDSDGLSAAIVKRELLAFMGEVKNRIGRQPWIYSRNGWLVNSAGNPDWPAGTKFWIARYGKTIGDLSPKIKPGVVIWQYTDRLKLPGLPAMDGNYWLWSMNDLNNCAYTFPANPADPPVIPEPVFPGKKGVVACSVLNVRNGPGVEYRVLGQLYHDNPITILNVVNGRWAEFEYKNYPSAYCAITSGDLKTKYVIVKA